MKTILKLATFFLAIPFLSCDPLTCGTDFIENHTSQTLYFLRTDSITVDTFLPGKIQIFEEQCGLGVGASPRHGYDYLMIRNADTICKKDIRLVDNWNFVKIEKRKWEYHFSVTDADF